MVLPVVVSVTTYIVGWTSSIVERLGSAQTAFKYYDYVLQSQHSYLLIICSIVVVLRINSQSCRMVLSLPFSKASIFAGRELVLALYILAEWCLFCGTYCILSLYSKDFVLPSIPRLTLGCICSIGIGTFLYALNMLVGKPTYYFALGFSLMAISTFLKSPLREYMVTNYVFVSLFEDTDSVQFIRHFALTLPLWVLGSLVSGYMIFRHVGQKEI